MIESSFKNDTSVSRRCNKEIFLDEIAMPSILKKDKRTTLKKRNVPHLSVKIDTVTVQEKTVSFDTTSLMETRNESFFESVWPVMYFAQFMGFMPIQGIRTGDPFKFEFRWRTFRVMITMIYVALGGFIAAMYFRQIARIGINAKNIVGLVFFSCALFCGLLFLSLAQRWKDLAMEWYRCEKVFLNLPYKESGWHLSTKIRITAVVVLLLAIVEHLMFLSSAIYNFSMKVIKCEPHFDDAWEYFFVNEHPHIFSVLPYHFVFTVILEWATISFTFGWNYIDTFIMVISIGLATRFQQINQRLEELENEPMDESVWAEIRHHHVLLCELVESVDKNLAVMTLLCTTNDLYFICFQLLNIFNKLPYLINFLYFWYSLLYLLGRTTGVFMIASYINDSAKYPVKFVRQRQSTEWCSELERFSDQITTQVVALSGMKFFFITRSLLFGMAGTIVTYELVLLQFDEGSKNAGNVTLCD